MKNIWAIILYSVCLISCGPLPNNQTDTVAYKEELKSREIQIVSEGKILAQAEAWGDSICQTSLGFSLRYPADTANNIPFAEKEIISAYQYALSVQESLIKNLQLVGEDSILYTLPHINSDSTLEIQVVWLSKKQVILSLL
ncbi:hypothetical protein QWY31_08675 [Cytophagales bacterium LB-30]|uniref:Lipoprotein n=1 Tax=Shiella aurantiaca TaxID=3058365 RepID=A0ABT8F5J8_9BACT|nr:hypothetical protein [Shiella aurantiaca]MDN4165573.1 hypothetical protein [Shiella aurantiaca]